MDLDELVGELADSVRRSAVEGDNWQERRKRRFIEMTLPMFQEL